MCCLLVQNLCLWSISCTCFLAGEAPASGPVLHPSGSLETLKQGWWAGGVPSSAASGRSPHPGKPKPGRLVVAQLQSQDCVQSCCVNRGTCVPTSSSLGPAPPVPPQNPTQNHCQTNSTTGNPRSTYCGQDDGPESFWCAACRASWRRWRSERPEVGVELLTAADAATWLVCFRASGHKLPWDSRGGCRAGGQRQGLGLQPQAGQPPKGH